MLAWPLSAISYGSLKLCDRMAIDDNLQSMAAVVVMVVIFTYWECEIISNSTCSSRNT
jgi:hypothetical protein